MASGKLRKRILYFFIAALAGLLVLWVAAPLWFPILLKAAAPRFGLTVTSYQRSGYRRLVLSDVSFTNSAARLQAKTVRLLIPTSWLYRVLQRRDSATEKFAQVEDWKYETVVHAGATNARRPAPSAEQIFNDAEKLTRRLARWIPVAAFTNGTIKLGARAVAIPSAVWDKSTLNVTAILPGQKLATSLKAEFNSQRTTRIALECPALHLRSMIRLTPNGPGLNLHSRNLWWGDRVDFSAQFAHHGLIPSTAALTAPRFHVPAEVVRLAAYQQPIGNFAVSWDQGRLRLNGFVRSQAESDTNLPPLEAIFSVVGDTNQLVIEKALIFGPGITARLSTNVLVTFHAPYVNGPAEFRIQADLKQQPWVEVDGQIAGDVRVQMRETNTPMITGTLSGRDLSYGDLRAKTVSIASALEWPNLQISELDADFEDGSKVSGGGAINLATKIVSDGKAEVSGALLNAFLPSGFVYKELHGATHFYGPATNLAHSGAVDLGGLSNKLLRASAVHLKWRGEMKNFSSVELVQQVASGSVQAEFGASIGTKSVSVELRKLLIQTNAQPALELKNPVTISMRAKTKGRDWSAELGPLDIAGPAGQINVSGSADWPQQGHGIVEIENIGSELQTNFLNADFPAVKIQTLRLAGGWTTNGPLVADATGRAWIFPNQSQTNASTNQSAFEKPVAIEIAIHVDGNGLALSNVVASTDRGRIASARGFLPVAILPGALSNSISFQPDRQIDIAITTQPDAFFWEQVSKVSGLSLTDPEFQLKLAGTWSAPLGSASLKARQIKLPSKKRAFPLLENLDAKLQINRQKVTLSQARLQIRGEPIEIMAELPLAESDWEGLREKKLPDWKRATGKFQIAQLDLAVLSEMAPTYLAPQGTLKADLALLPELHLEGQVLIQKARTRPLPSVGPIRDIDVKLLLHDRKITLDRMTGLIGGALTQIDGNVDLSGDEWMQGKLPPFKVAVSGTNIPLSRKTDSIIRSDLAIEIQKSNAGPPKITGTARLRDSFYLSDVRDLVPGRVATPQRRPPYFSVDDPLLADWQLSVLVSGPRFLSVRSTLFNGQISSNLRLQGTLQEPLVLGDVKIDSGVIRFPFANLEVNQGIVMLSSQDPYRPRLLVSAASKRFGYDVKMEMTGPADAPVIQFSSSPPLSSDQILLMVTAGQIPRSDYTLTPQQKAQTVALFLGKDLLSKLGLGGQGEDRLNFSSGEDISESGRPTYNLEYKLNRKWSVVGEYDRFNAFNAGLKWRVYSK
jgi:translocation and assembly module TamB